MLTLGSLFSGIAGLEEGLRMALPGSKVLWQCDTDPSARAVLAAHYPGVRIYEDVREIDARAARVSLICGGFSCQPHSVAGRRKGTEDARWIWPEFARIIGALRPELVFIENVPGLRSSGLRDVLADLAALGFDAEWDLFSAAEVGAPHIRRRLFILAYANGSDLREQSGRGSRPRGEGAPLARANGTEGSLAHSNGSARGSKAGDALGGLGREALRAGKAEPRRRGGDVVHPDGEGELPQEGRESEVRRRSGNGGGEALAYSNGLRLLRRAHDEATARQARGHAAEGDHPGAAKSGLGVLPDGLPPWMAGAVEPPRTAKGAHNRTDRLRLLGNSCCPAQAAWAFRSLSERAAAGRELWETV